jgi:hypothetical protein
MNHPTPNQMAALVDGRLWVADDGSWRIYMDSRKDATVYFKSVFRFREASACNSMEYFYKATLVISFNDCNQSANWYASQKKRLAERYMTAAIALAFAHSSMEAAEAIMLEEVPEMTAEVIDEAMGHLANGRTSEALAAIGYEGGAK